MIYGITENLGPQASVWNTPPLPGGWKNFGYKDSLNTLVSFSLDSCTVTNTAASNHSCDNFDAFDTSSGKHSGGVIFQVGWFYIPVYG